MSKIYKNQDALYIEMDVGEDITGATCLVAYRKPSGVYNSWVGTITDATNGIFRYTMADSDQLDEAGKWTFWADVTFATNARALGESVTEEVYEAGD